MVILGCSFYFEVSYYGIIDHSNDHKQDHEKLIFLHFKKN